MSEGMPPWKYLSSASSRISSFSEYLQGSQGKKSSKRGPGQAASVEAGCNQWAGQKIKLRRGTRDGNGSLDTETLNLFPGWAVRRYRKIGSSEPEDAFEVEVYISGFAITRSSTANASRSQRAFIRLAKGFASLPKITADALEPTPEAEPLMHPDTRSSEELLAQKKLPPRPTEITEDCEINTLEHVFQRANLNRKRRSPSSSCSSSMDSGEQTPESPHAEPIIRNRVTALPADALRKFHANLESRLQPFWSSVLASRTIRLQLFASPHQYTTHRRDSQKDRDAMDYGPFAAQDVVTAADGSFHARFVVKWEDLCQHPGALHIAFGDRCEENDLLVAAELLPAQRNPSSSSSGLESPVEQGRTVSPPKTIHISITHSPIRVISDIDDTVKLSNIISGARAAFHNVFVKDLKENIIPGMGEWYTSMWRKGIRFHYVSNGPFALLPVLREFFQISQLPPGSMKLRSYTCRSILNGLLAPALRKRAGVIEILDAFPESRFFLIGDTGEQDLELYAEFSRKRPNQILAVLVRDVETGEPLEDPTGWKAVEAITNSVGVKGSPDDRRRPRRTLSDLSSGRSTPATRRRPRRTLSDLLSGKSTPATSPLSSRSSTAGGDYFTPSPVVAEPEQMSNASTTPTSASALHTANGDTLIVPMPTPPDAGTRPHPVHRSSDATVNSTSSTTSMSSLFARLPEAEKRRYALQKRVYVARTQMPGHVPLRVFRDPRECVEVEEILGRGQQV